jgi:hypothetical protein
MELNDKITVTLFEKDKELYTLTSNTVLRCKEHTHTYFLIM